MAGFSRKEWAVVAVASVVAFSCPALWLHSEAEYWRAAHRERLERVAKAVARYRDETGVPPRRFLDLARDGGVESDSAAELEQTTRLVDGPPLQVCDRHGCAIVPGVTP